MLYLLFSPFALFTVFRLFHLAKNYFAARRFGLPIVLLPVAFDDIWWIPLRPLFSWVERLPFGLGSWYIYTEMGWPTVEGNRTLLRLNTENFVLCSPKGVQVATCYPPALEKVTKENKNWPQPASQSQLFAVYGQNVSSTTGEEWKRHRKITASAFNENSMKRVWDESIKQAADLNLGGERAKSLKRIRSTFDLFAMRVLAVVGFGQENAALTEVGPGHRESLMDSLGFILEHVMLTLIFSGLKAPDFILPKLLRRLKVSMVEFRLHMQEMVLSQMQNSSSKEKGQSRSLLEAMVQANEAEKQQLQNPSKRPSYLTESELYGNLFVFNLAGYETTSSTMTFALSYLAAHPEAQEWVIEEVDAYYKTSGPKDYAIMYPKLVRCLAIMHETLRHASPGPLLMRTPHVPQELPIITPNGQRTIVVQPGMAVGIHAYGAHLSPRWGADADVFDPKRFVSTSPTGEAFILPEHVAYLPWISGPRVCPGKKFSEVEFVATLAEILSEFRIDAKSDEKERLEVAQKRLMRVLDDKFFNISTHLKRPEDAGVRFVPRNEK